MEFVKTVDPVAFTELYKPQPSQPVNQPANIIKFQLAQFTELYERLNRLVVLTTYRQFPHTLTYDEIEEICGDAWAYVLTYIQTGRCKFLLEGLIWSNVRKKVLTALTRANLYGRILAKIHPITQHTPDLDTGLDTHKLLATLPVEPLQLVKAYYWQGQTMAEIAAHLGITGETAKKRLHRIVKQLSLKIV
jgi:RNA polymerase sigma factor (sigma-70 family)